MDFRRRGVLLSMAIAGLLSPPHRAFARDRVGPARIGFLSTTSPERNPQLEAFRAGLRDLGYVEGENIEIDYRWAQGDLHQRPDIARDLVRQGVDLIVAWGTPATVAARAATASVPIVFIAVADPVGSGFVTSLAQPGGNITGASNAMVDIGGKWVELMAQVAPEANPVAVLRNPANAGSIAWAREAQQAAHALGRRVMVFDATSSGDIDLAFDAMDRDGAKALIITGDPLFAGERARLAEQANRRHLPSSFVASFYPEAGGLMSYGMDVKAMFRAAAGFVVRILNGARPDELPVERPTVFQWVINLNTARRIGIEIPRSVLLRADRIID